MSSHIHKRTQRNMLISLTHTHTHTHSLSPHPHSHYSSPVLFFSLSFILFTWSYTPSFLFLSLCQRVNHSFPLHVSCSLPLSLSHSLCLSLSHSLSPPLSL